MSENQEFHSQIIEVRGRLQSIPSTQALIKANRFLLLTVIVLTVLVAVLGYFIVPPDPAGVYMKRHEASATGEPHHLLSSEVNALKGQVIGLVSGSIESKLRMLEDSIRLGMAASSLGTIEDLKNDVRVLRSYSEPASKGEKPADANERVLEEMSQLKRLIYVSLGACGLMLAAIAGIWFKNLNILTYKQTIKSYLNKH